MGRQMTHAPQGHALVKAEAGSALVGMTPRAPAAGMVRVRVMCAGICRTDIHAARGRLFAARGRVLGHEIAGTVGAIGSGVDAAWQGAAVTVNPLLPCGRCPGCLSASLCHAPAMFGVDADGGFATWAMVPAAQLVRTGALPWRHAAFVEPLAATLAIVAPVKRAAEAVGKQGQRGLVVGRGRLATLAARVLTHAGLDPVVCAPDLPATDASAALGTSPAWAVDTSGRAAGIALATAVLRPRGHLVFKSRPADAVAMPMARWVHKELTMTAAGYAPFADAVALLGESGFDVGDMLGRAFAPDAFEAAFAAAEASEAQKLFLDFARLPGEVD